MMFWCSTDNVWGESPLLLFTLEESLCLTQTVSSLWAQVERQFLYPCDQQQTTAKPKGAKPKETRQPTYSQLKVTQRFICEMFLPN